MGVVRHETILDALTAFTLAVVVINSVFLAGALLKLKRLGEREEAAEPAPREARRRAAGSGQSRGVGVP
jgi:hypothetical protein